MPAIRNQNEVDRDMSRKETETHNECADIKLAIIVLHLTLNFTRYVTSVLITTEIFRMLQTALLCRHPRAYVADMWPAILIRNYVLSERPLSPFVSQKSESERRPND